MSEGRERGREGALVVLLLLLEEWRVDMLLTETREERRRREGRRDVVAVEVRGMCATDELRSESRRN